METGATEQQQGQGRALQGVWDTGHGTARHGTAGWSSSSFYAVNLGPAWAAQRHTQRKGGREVDEKEKAKDRPDKVAYPCSLSTWKPEADGLQSKFQASQRNKMRPLKEAELGRGEEGKAVKQANGELISHYKNYSPLC